MKKSSKFIVFEGGEGSGKSTLLRALDQILKSSAENKLRSNKTVLSTREPGGSPLGEQIRSLLIHQKMRPLTELFLYQAARAEHVQTVIQPALDRGEIVLCDRYFASTYAYQGAARNLSPTTIHQLCKIAIDGCKPDLTVYLVGEPKTLLKRVAAPNRFEAESLEFHRKVKSGFDKLFEFNNKKLGRMYLSKKYGKILALEAHSASPEILANKILKVLWG